MGKNKGRQCGGFPSKAMRAAFVTEWQTAANKHVTDAKQKRKQSHGHNTTNSNKTLLSERPRFRLSHLQNVLKERVQEDRMQDRARRQQRTTATNSPTLIQQTPSPPTSFNTYNDENDGYHESGLALLCIQALAPVLQDYIREMGRERVHHMLSLLPGKTLTALSVELSKRQLWSNKDVLYVVAQHAHIVRLVVCLSDNASFTPEALHDALVIAPQCSLTNPYRIIPDSWEDEQEDFIMNQPGIRRLQRLELCNMPLLSAETMQSLVSSQTTHLTLVNTLDASSGPIFIEELAANEYNHFDLNISAFWVDEEVTERLKALCLSSRRVLP